MPISRKEKAIQILRQCIHHYGPDGYDTKIAAIQACHAYEMDPYYRYAVWPKFEPMALSGAVAGPATIESIEEWQRMIRRVGPRKRPHTPANS